MKTDTKNQAGPAVSRLSTKLDSMPYGCKIKGAAGCTECYSGLTKDAGGKCVGKCESKTRDWIVCGVYEFSECIKQPGGGVHWPICSPALLASPVDTRRNFR